MKVEHLVAKEAILAEAWLAVAPKRLAAAFLKERGLA